MSKNYSIQTKRPVTHSKYLTNETTNHCNLHSVYKLLLLLLYHYIHLMTFFPRQPG